MSGRTLPLYNDFFKTFQNYTIENWEAKKFIEYVLMPHSQNIKNRQKVYNGIHLLVKCGYLTKVSNPRQKGTYLYSETHRITDYRSTKTLESIETILNGKLEDLSNNINAYYTEIEFIRQIKSEHPDIASQLEPIENDKLLNLDSLIIKKKLIDNLQIYFKTKN